MNITLSKRKLKDAYIIQSGVTYNICIDNNSEFQIINRASYSQYLKIKGTRRV